MICILVCHDSIRHSIILLANFLPLSECKFLGIPKYRKMYVLKTIATESASFDGRGNAKLNFVQWSMQNKLVFSIW